MVDIATREGATLAAGVKARKIESSYFESDYYRWAVKVAFFLIFMVTFSLIVLLTRFISSLFLLLEYSFQSLRKVNFAETEKKVELPTQSGHERRKYPRFDVYWPIQYNPTGSSVNHLGRVTNLSEGGMVIQSSGRMEIGQRLKSKVSFILGAQINTIEMQAEVVWRDAMREALTDHRCGAKFLGLSPTDKSKLNDLLISLSQSSSYPT